MRGYLFDSVERPFHRLAPGKESPFPYNDGNLKSVAALRELQLFANRLHTVITGISTAALIFPSYFKMRRLFKGGDYSRAALIFKEKKQNNFFINTIYLFNEPVQNKKKTQYCHFELQHTVESVGISRSL